MPAWLNFPRDREDPSAARCSVQPRAVALVFSAFDAGRRVAQPVLVSHKVLMLGIKGLPFHLDEVELVANGVRDEG